MSNMYPKRAKNEIEISQFTLALVRHTPRPSSQSLSNYLRSTSHNLYPTNPALHTKQTTLDNFRETPARHMSSKKPSLNSSEAVFAMIAAPPVLKYNRNDSMDLIKHLRALEIAAGRPNPFSTFTASPLRSRWMRLVGKPGKALLLQSTTPYTV